MKVEIGMISGKVIIRDPVDPNLLIFWDAPTKSFNSGLLIFNDDSGNREIVINRANIEYIEVQSK